MAHQGSNRRGRAQNALQDALASDPNPKGLQLSEELQARGPCRHLTSGSEGNANEASGACCASRLLGPGPHRAASARSPAAPAPSRSAVWPRPSAQPPWGPAAGTETPPGAPGRCARARRGRTAPPPAGSRSSGAGGPGPRPGAPRDTAQHPTGDATASLTRHGPGGRRPEVPALPSLATARGVWQYGRELTKPGPVHSPGLKGFPELPAKSLNAAIVAEAGS